MGGDDASIPGRILHEQAEGLPEVFEVREAQLRGGNQRRQAREEQCLRTQDVAHARDALLVQQCGREGSPSTAEGLEGLRGGGLRAQRILSEPGAEGGLGLGAQQLTGLGPGEVERRMGRGEPQPARGRRRRRGEAEVPDVADESEVDVQPHPALEVVEEVLAMRVHAHERPPREAAGLRREAPLR